jgi:hypothetical protein
MKDVFISYRKKDANTEAYLLCRDLIKAGYSVFYDDESLGAGNYLNALQEQVRSCGSVIILLSAASFDSRINDDADVFRSEIRWALNHKKRVIGIMLESFDGFPSQLPGDIDNVRYIHSLPLYMHYYEAAFAKLVSGSFLPPPSQLSAIPPAEDAIQADIPEGLKNLSILPSEQRMQCSQLLLQLMRSFNDSSACMRFYRYIDLCDRSIGEAPIPEYDGEIPADLTTYLSFFETLYIIIGSGTIDLSLIDFAYRFRFFAGCNTPLMQQSELLPLGYQYPNILSLYNMWCDYIVNHHDHSVQCDSISNLIPLYQFDLHKQYAAYSFSQKPNIPKRIRFLNRNLQWLNATLRRMDIKDLDDSMFLQENVVSVIADNETRNVFEPLTLEEMRKSLEKDYCIGIYAENRLVAQMNLILDPLDFENLVLDIPNSSQYSNAGILDYVVVHPNVRGYSIQRTFLFLADCIGRNARKSGICAVTSPLNSHSIKNFCSQGYRIVDTREKYHSNRHYLWKPL